MFVPLDLCCLRLSSMEFSISSKKKRKRKWTLQFYTLPNFKKRQKNKIKILKLNSRTKWIYEPTFGSG
jgi:hypothetical protein